jgi:uncharacterized Zn finger protein (UPF0148 family)
LFDEKMKIIFTLMSFACFFIAFKAFGSSTPTALGLGLLGAIILAATHRRRRADSPPPIQSTGAGLTITIPRQHGASRKRDFETVGNIDAVCPYCNQALEKKPGRKKTCPHCGQFIYVRTRPSDEQQVLVTEPQAEQIEEQWSIVNGTHDAYLADKKRFTKEKAKLAKRFGREPSDNDVRWSQLNQQLIENARQRNWGLFRNAKFEMAEILRKEDRSTTALGFYLEVCYLDLNGPNNTGEITGRELLREYPPWNPKGPTAELAPGVLERAARIIQKTDLATVTVEEIYRKRASILHTSLRLPLSPASAWLQIREALFEKKDERASNNSVEPIR